MNSKARISLSISRNEWKLLSVNDWYLRTAPLYSGSLQLEYIPEGRNARSLSFSLNTRNA